MDSIVALSSGSLPAGVAVVRISGPAAREAIEALTGRPVEPRRASYRRIIDAAGSTLDKGVILFFPGPNSVTGEDIAEFHLHGGRAVVAACLDALTRIKGVRLAEAGEFTRRAFENGRIDLTEAEGLADLLSAETEMQRRLAISQSDGVLRELYEGWMARLTHARAMIEAGFDFSDEEDVDEAAGEAARADMARLADEMRAHLDQARRGEILREGFRVVIAGPPNAGKSSLLNRLAEREVAIVSDVPGTTRDILEVRLDLRGLAVRFSDTAGLRETTDKVEAIGVEWAERAVREADMVLLLDDGREGAVSIEDRAGLLSHVKHSGAPPLVSSGEAEPGRQTVLRLRTKSDLVVPGSELPGGYDLAISARTGDGIDALVECIAAEAERAASGDAAPGGPFAVPARTRHKAVLREALDALEDYLTEPSLPAEIAAEALRRTGDRLGALTGRVGVEDLLDVIFSEFCIGK